VRQPIEKIAEKVATKLIQKINGESPQSEMVKVELIERESSNIS
jgi:DNA-binding LacI/PurR family transcriptional regulator